MHPPDRTPLRPPAHATDSGREKKIKYIYSRLCVSAGVSNGSSFVFGFRIGANFSAQTFAITRQIRGRYRLILFFGWEKKPPRDRAVREY